MNKSRKKSDAAGENGASLTVDIPHEEVKSPPADAVAITPKVMTVEDQIKTEIVKFNFTDAAIGQLKETYGGLTIKDETDKAGYEAVKKAWNDVRTKRTGLEKKGLEIRNSYTAITKAIKGEEVRLIELITPLEDDLYSKWKKIDDDKEKAKKEKEEAEGRQLMARIEALQECGMAFRDGFYQIGDTITVDVASLRAMPKETYEKLKNAVITKAAEIKREKDLQAEQKRQAEAEHERQRQELKKQQDELAAQQRELILQRQEMAKQLRDMRLGKLHGLGMELEGDQVIKWESVRLYIAPLIEMTADEFNRTVEITADQIKELKNKKAKAEEDQKKAAAEKDRREKLIAKNLEAIGMTFDFGRSLFQFKTPDTEEITAQFGHFGDMDDAGIMNVCVHLGTRIDKSKADQKKIDDDRETERKKQEKLGLTDKTRWDRDLAQLEAQAQRQIIPKEFKTNKYQVKSDGFLNRFINLVNEFK